MLNYTVVQFLTIWGSSILLSKKAASFCIFRKRIQGSNLSISSLIFVIFYYFSNSHPIKCDFDMHSHDSDVEQFFITPSAICIYSWKNKSIQHFCSFLIGYLFYFLLSSFLNVLNINTLPCSIGCLCTLLIVCVCVQRLLIWLINLSNFHFVACVFGVISENVCQDQCHDFPLFSSEY